MKSKKILILGTTILSILIIIVGVSFAIFTYSSIGSNQELVLGDIYMHYNEGNGIALTDALPYQIKDIVNPVMQTQEYEKDTRNELSKCVDSVSSWWSFDEGEDPESFCKGTGTNYGSTFQKGIDEDWFSDSRYEFLTSNNIITSDNLVNPIMQNQTYEKDTRNELSKCVDSFSEYVFYEGEDPESFCKGTGTYSGYTFQERIDDHYWFAYILYKYNVIVSTLYNLPYFEFTISGKNTYTEKDIWYEIVLMHGDNTTTRTTRIEDKFLGFTLVEIKDNVETIVVDEMTYSDLQNKKIYVNIIEKNTTSEVNITYRLYMWIDYNTVIGNVNQDYTEEEWQDVYASIKVKVNGVFNKNNIISPILNLNVSSYNEASSSRFSGGLVAINTDGELYDETDTSQKIREYRYSGLNVNNYIFLDTDGDGVQDDNEMWRIVGIFKNTSGEWNLKLMRNTILTADEIPQNYTYNGTRYSLKMSSTGPYVYWNGDNKATNYNDWTTSTLQYFLNDYSGYYGTLSGIQNIIDTNYTYYLGNYSQDFIDGSSLYNAERDASNIWEGNKATWNGAIGLLYLSDYIYSGWETSWINTLNEYYEWFISPSSSETHYAACWNSFGVSTNSVTGFIGGSIVTAARPVLNLLSSVEILKGDGTQENPYKLDIPPIEEEQPPQ